MYELYAISNHIGDLDLGHYTTYAKNNGRWFEFDDEKVQEVSKSSISS
jgi:ubiquitin C-terminal hydrolase